MRKQFRNNNTRHPSYLLLKTLPHGNPKLSHIFSQSVETLFQLIWVGMSMVNDKKSKVG